ncbi:MAG: erythromycin esterase family protein [Chitinophagaceae bacterium]
MKLFIALLLSAFFPIVKVFCQKNVETINALNTIIKPIENIHSEDSFDDIDFLKDATKEAAIIGIGESTHGTSLYNTYRQRLVRFLVQEMNYKAIIDEGDILAAEKVDAYINGKTDNLDLIGGLRPVITNKKELDWLRAFNLIKPENDRIHIYGAEVRGFYGIAQKIKSFFPDYANGILRKLEGDIGVGYKNLTKKDFEDISNLSKKLKDESNNPAQLHYLSLLDQQINFAYNQRFGKSDFSLRDQYMFDNIKHVVSGIAGNKAIVLAHNGHLQKTKFMSLASLGYLLNNFYDNKYFVIATDFNIGNVNVYNLKTGDYENKFFEDVQDENACEYYFSKCKYPNFSISIRNAFNDPATKLFMDKKLKMERNITATGDIIKSSISLAENFDLIIFFKNADIEN